jgi:hypothetical protein
MLLLWLIACVGVYILVPQFPPHALSGATLPLGVLAVRGWRRAQLRAHLPRRLAAAAATAGILAFSVPAAFYHAQQSHDYLTSGFAAGITLQQLRLTANQAAGLAYLDHVSRPGGVLAPWLLSMSVPAFTGREAFAGHPNWQPQVNMSIAARFFDPALTDPGGALRRALLRQTKATFVLADCGAPASLTSDIAPIARAVKRFGCVTVYETTSRPLRPA